MVEGYFSGATKRHHTIDRSIIMCTGAVHFEDWLAQVFALERTRLASATPSMSPLFALLHARVVYTPTVLQCVLSTNLVTPQESPRFWYRIFEKAFSGCQMLHKVVQALGIRNFDPQ